MLTTTIGRAGLLCVCLTTLAAGEPKGKPKGKPAPDRGSHPSVQGASPDARHKEPVASPIDALRERILAHLALRPGMVVAEIGIGGGWFVFRAAQAVGPNGVVYGTDIDPERIASVKRRLRHIDPAAARVELRLCREGRDTALDDLPDDHVDVVLMIDSLCFDRRESHERNVAYLRQFLRILRNGGRLVHHMDCQCDVAPEAVLDLFKDAGFSARIGTVAAPPDPAVTDPTWPCQTDATRRRHAFIAVFQKAPPGANALSPRTAGELNHRGTASTEDDRQSWFPPVRTTYTNRSFSVSSVSPSRIPLLSKGLSIFSPGSGSRGLKPTAQPDEAG